MWLLLEAIIEMRASCIGAATRAESCMVSADRTRKPVVVEFVS